MHNKEILEAIEDTPIIMAVKDRDGVDKCLQLDSRVVFVLFGDICTIEEIVKKIKAAGKIVIVHIDLISGLGNKEVAVDFLSRLTGLDGIISTKPALVKRAKELGIFSILRVFVLDSLALANIKKQEAAAAPDMIEMLPGVMPKITKRITDTLTTPVICGGLISDKEDILHALDAGATAVSTTNAAIWGI